MSDVDQAITSQMVLCLRKLAQCSPGTGYIEGPRDKRIVAEMEAMGLVERLDSGTCFIVAATDAGREAAKLEPYPWDRAKAG